MTNASRNLIAKAVLVAATFVATVAHADKSGDAELLKRLGESKHSLVDGIKQAEKANGAAISAKFEVEEGKLWLSVYTAKNGRDKDAEHNTLMELKGEPSAAEWRPKTEIFEDKEHLARSAMQLTLLQLSKLSLADVIKKASAGQKGTVYSAIPAVNNGKPVVVVLFATPDGKTTRVDVDLQTGKAALQTGQATKS
jgi:uncharacterized membrane protein YkoI